jgi:hypothetical protein
MRKIIHFFDKDGPCWRWETAADRLADELEKAEKEKRAEKEICKICRKEIKAPECYWESYDCCSACIRKAALEINNNQNAERSL